MTSWWHSDLQSSGAVRWQHGKACLPQSRSYVVDFGLPWSEMLKFLTPQLCFTSLSFFSYSNIITTLQVETCTQGSLPSTFEDLWHSTEGQTFLQTAQHVANGCFSVLLSRCMLFLFSRKCIKCRWGSSDNTNKGVHVTHHSHQCGRDFDFASASHTSQKLPKPHHKVQATWWGSLSFGRSLDAALQRTL